nr:MAG TPA: hypothetical protein [Caudoviricetes sp.]
MFFGVLRDTLFYSKTNQVNLYSPIYTVLL